MEIEITGPSRDARRAAYKRVVKGKSLKQNKEVDNSEIEEREWITCWVTSLLRSNRIPKEAWQ